MDGEREKRFRERGVSVVITNGGFIEPVPPNTTMLSGIAI